MADAFQGEHVVPIQVAISPEDVLDQRDKLVDLLRINPAQLSRTDRQLADLFSNIENMRVKKFISDLRVEMQELDNIRGTTFTEDNFRETLATNLGTARFANWRVIEDRCARLFRKLDRLALLPLETGNSTLVETLLDRKSLLLRPPCEAQQKPENSPKPPHRHL